MIRFKLFQRLLITILFSVFALQAVAQDYTFSQSSIPFDLRDASVTGTFVALSDDAVSGAVPIGFSFTFYGNTYTQAYISSNGFFTFSSGQQNGCCSGQDLPDPSNPNNLVAAYWEDFNLPQGAIYYETMGTAPNREFVVGFYDNPHFFDGPLGTFEMILHEGSNNIEFQFGDNTSDGGTHTTGVENIDGTAAYQIAHGDYSFSQTGFLLVPDYMEPVPTLAATMLIVLVLLLGMLGFWQIRRRGLVV